MWWRPHGKRHQLWGKFSASTPWWPKCPSRAPVPLGRSVVLLECDLCRRTLSSLSSYCRSCWNRVRVLSSEYPWNWVGMHPSLSSTVLMSSKRSLGLWTANSGAADRWDWTPPPSLMSAHWRIPFQTCICANRMLVQEGIHDEFVAGFKSAIQGLKVGDGFDNSVTQGPLINAKAVDKVGALSSVSGKNRASLYLPSTGWGPCERRCVQGSYAGTGRAANVSRPELFWAYSANRGLHPDEMLAGRDFRACGTHHQVRSLAFRSVQHSFMYTFS